MSSILHRVHGLFVSDASHDRGNNINIMRFVAASAVIAGHMAVFTGTNPPLICSTSVSAIAVFIFFLLSGYLISTSYIRDGNPFRYLVRRVLRIIPGLILVTTVAALFIGPLCTTEPIGAYFRNGLTWRYLLNCVLNPQYALPGVFMDSLYPNAVNGSLWTLPVEFFMYLITPLTLVIFSKLHIERQGMCATAVIVAVLALLIQSGRVSCDIVVWGTRLDTIPLLATFFYIGACVAVMPELLKRTNVEGGLLILLLLTLMVPRSSAWAVLLLFILLPYVVFSFAFAPNARFGRVFAENDYSYGVYLWAFPIQQIVVSILGPSAVSPLAFTCISFACTLPLAMLSWHLVEKPAMALGRKISAWSRGREQR